MAELKLVDAFCVICALVAWLISVYHIVKSSIMLRKLEKEFEELEQNWRRRSGENGQI